MPAYEPDAVAFPGGPDADLTSVAQALDAETVEALEAYLDGQPTAEEVSAMAPDELERLAQHRLWALVSYLQSLERPRRWWYKLLVEDPDLTGKEGR